MNSKFLTLNWRDAGKGLVIAVLVAVLQIFTTLLQNKGFSITWADLGPVLDIALKAGGAYVVKNFFSTADGKFLGAV